MIKIPKIAYAIIGIFLWLTVYITNHAAGIALLILFAAYLIYSRRSYYYSVRAAKLYSAGMTDEALRLYEKAAKIKSSTPRVKHSYAYLLLKNKQVEESLKVLDDLLASSISEADKNNTKLTYSLAKWKSGKLDEAVEILEGMYPNFKTTILYENLGYLLILQGNYERALEINLEGFEYNNSSNVTCDNLGETYYHLGDYAKSAEIYEDLVKKEPKFPEAYYHYALTLLKLEEPAKALENLKKALEFPESYLSNITHEDIKNTIKQLENVQE